MPKRRVRPAVAAFPAVLLAALLLRTLLVGVGADEFSLLTMAHALRDGFLPYAVHWDVRPPLAYLLGLPSAYADDAASAVAIFRMLAWLAQAAAAWVFFCLFQRTLGVASAALGALALLVAANMTGLHALAMPNHFSMALSVVAFACLVAGLRGRSLAYGFSALLAGVLPWIMVHAGLLALSLAALAVLGAAQRDAPPSRSRRPPSPPSRRSPPLRRSSVAVDGASAQDAAAGAGGDDRVGQCSRRHSRRWLLWLALAAAPSTTVVAAYYFLGPFDVFARTVFLAPFGVAEMRSGGGYVLFAWADAWRLLCASPWVVVQAALLATGAVCLPSAMRKAPQGSPLRLCAFLVLPLTAGFALMAYAKPPAPPEYWIDMAPVVGLLVAAAISKVLSWRVWSAPGVARYARLAVLRGCLTVYFGVALLLPADPWREAPQPPLPPAFCRDQAAYWVKRLGPGRTVLDVVGICGFHLLQARVALHPPFTFAPMWLRQLDQPWVGQALDGDGAGAAAAERLRQALAAESSVGLILADNRLLQEIRARGWEGAFYQHWRLAWFRQLEGRDQDEPLASLAVLVRRQQPVSAVPPKPCPAPRMQGAGDATMRGDGAVGTAAPSTSWPKCAD